MTRSLKRSLRGCRLRPSLRLCLFEEGWSLDAFGFLLPIAMLDRVWKREPHEIMESWGPYYFENSVVWTWGDYVKFFHMPWDWDFIKCEVQRPDGTWVKEVNSWDGGEPDGRWEGSFSYSYTLKSGEVQRRTAKVHVDRREWRRKWLRWCPVLAKVRTSIDITFDGEVGERTGSWKGGCIGCGWEMLPGETPEQTLRRMEREREFN